MTDNIHVHFVRADHSLVGVSDGGQGIVTNPDVYFKDKESFIERIQNLIASCNKSGDDLSIWGLIFDDGKNEQAVAPNDSTEHLYKATEDLIATISRMLWAVKAGTNPKFDFAREMLQRQPTLLALT